MECRVRALPLLLFLFVRPPWRSAHASLSLTPGVVHHFLDFDGIASSTNVSVVLGAPVKLDAPAVVPQYPWESMLHFYTSAVTVPPSLSPTGRGLFVLYYSCLGRDAMYLCVANSSDGVVWAKPLLPFFPWTDGTPTNRVFRTNDTVSWPGSVTVDAAPGVPAAEAFKLSYEGAGGERLLYVATSPDGYAWSRRAPEEPVIAVRLFSDTQTAVLWDAARGEHVAFGRRDADVPGAGADAGCEGNYPSLRRVLRAASASGATGEYSAPTEVLSPGAPDAFACLDIYNPAPTLLRDGTVLLFPSSFRHFSTNETSPPGAGGNASARVNDGVLDIRLAASRDGANYSFVSRDAFLARGVGYRDPATGAFSLADSDRDAGFVFATAGGVLDPDDLAPRPAAPPLRFAVPSARVALLYWGTQRTHTGSSDTPGVFQGVLRAALRREGFAGLRSPPTLDGYGAAELATVPLAVPSPRDACPSPRHELWLLLNVQASVAGGVRVALLAPAAASAPLPGRALADAAPFVGDAVRAPATWRDEGGGLVRDLAPFAGSQVVVQVELLHATLWAWEVQCVPPAAAVGG